ncbi:MAG: pseudouridine synthase [Planctomycetota bacterium]
MSQIRLHKFLAHSGLASRRHSEGLIQEGKISVNGRIITELGFLIDPAKDKVYYEGRLLKPEPKVYYIVNKPKGYLCTNAVFPAKGNEVMTYIGHEPRVVDLIKTRERLYTVGRLDKESEGLIIATNDGEFAQRVSHPSFEVPKTYFVSVRGHLDGAVMEKVQKGIWLSEGRTSRTRIKILKREREFTSLLITLTEGKKREVRRIFARFHYPVKQLKRIQIGNLHLGDLKQGQYRQVTYKELAASVLPQVNQSK